eukprot:GHRR01035486.1.p2 GENE.GHRR01035486.1~~GHRR01035486.1.p2  ORF type:complete len:121 (+),score=9.15 GHRR01035486.1:1050-1412(+)
MQHAGLHHVPACDICDVLEIPSKSFSVLQRAIQLGATGILLVGPCRATPDACCCLPVNGETAQASLHYTAWYRSTGKLSSLVLVRRLAETFAHLQQKLHGWLNCWNCTILMLGHHGNTYS